MPQSSWFHSKDAVNKHIIGDQDQEDHVSRPSSAKRSQETPTSTNGCTVWHAPVIPATWGSINRKISVQASPGIM
jgi:hypothetical protein